MVHWPLRLPIRGQPPVPRLEMRRPNLTPMLEGAPASERRLGRPPRFPPECLRQHWAAAGCSSTPGRSGRPRAPTTSRKQSLTVFLPLQGCLDKISQ